VRTHTGRRPQGFPRWSPPGRARVVAPKVAPVVRPICPFCFQPGVHRNVDGCLNALSSPQQRGWTTGFK